MSYFHLYFEFYIKIKSNFSRFVISLFFLISFSNTSLGQNIIFGTNNYVEYHKGTLPIVISVPHGGTLTPNSIPDRTCNSPVLVTDANTIALAQNISTSLYSLTGCIPHIIYCNLKRSKLDCNRNLSDGACGNPEAIIAWNEFHDFLDTAQNLVQTEYNGNILYIDLHGHGNPIQRIELGYLLYSDELELSDSILNSTKYIEFSSIQNLIYNNQNNYNHSQLLKGDFALGTLLANKGYPSVPSQQIPYPGASSNYFSGGYNTANYTSYNNSSSVNGMQMECNYTGIRDNETNRIKFADSLSVVLLDYLNIHRNVNVSNCNLFTESNNLSNQLNFKIYPNPLSQSDYLIHLEGIGKFECDYQLLNIDGSFLDSGVIIDSIINLKKTLIHGIYLLKIETQQQSVFTKLIVK